MFVMKCFGGDDNHQLAEIQHQNYMDSAGIIYGLARVRFILSCEIVSYYPNAFKIIKEKVRFDHRPIQDAHDILAAYYRYVTKQQSIQGDLFNHANICVSEWSNWLENQVKNLCEEPIFVKSVVYSLTSPSSGERELHERLLGGFLYHRYSLGSWATAYESYANYSPQRFTPF